MFEIVSFTLGPAQTNAYLVADPQTKEAVVIDPSWDGHIILKAAQDRGLIAKRLGDAEDQWLAASEAYEQAAGAA